MHRTQVLLKEVQYEALREQARQDGKSLGAVVRELLETALDSSRAGRRRKVKLGTLKGMFHRADLQGRRHDEYLYGDR